MRYRKDLVCVLFYCQINSAQSNNLNVRTVSLFLLQRKWESGSYLLCWAALSGDSLSSLLSVQSVHTSNTIFPFIRLIKHYLISARQGQAVHSLFCSLLQTEIWDGHNEFGKGNNVKSVNELPVWNCFWCWSHLLITDRIALRFTAEY